MADLPAALGAQHCAASECQRLDFLPATCPYCRLVWCSEHAATARHACPQDPERARVADGARFQARFVDLLPDRTRDAQAVSLQREAESTALQSKRTAALALLAKNFGPVQPKPRSTPPQRTTTTTTSPIVALMKLKQRAKPGDVRQSATQVPMDARIYLCVSQMDALTWIQTGEPWEVWLPKVCPRSTTSKAHSADSLIDGHIWQSARPRRGTL